MNKEISSGKYINKVVYYGDVLVDLTDASFIEPPDILSGYKAYGRSGQLVTGQCTYDSDTSSATATASQILSGQTAYAKGSKVIGTMVNNGAVTGTISSKTGQYTVPVGFHDGSGKVGIASAEQAKIVAENIKQGITILGITGTYSGEGVTLQSKTVTPQTTSQTVTADSGYDALSQVTVNAIPYIETENDFGGITVTIGITS